MFPLVVDLVFLVFSCRRSCFRQKAIYQIQLLCVFDFVLSLSCPFSVIARWLPLEAPLLSAVWQYTTFFRMALPTRRLFLGVAPYLRVSRFSFDVDEPTCLVVSCSHLRKALRFVGFDTSKLAMALKFVAAAMVPGGDLLHAMALPDVFGTKLKATEEGFAEKQQGTEHKMHLF